MSTKNESSPSGKIEAKKFIAYLQNAPGWNILHVNDVPRLNKQFQFKNFQEALAFTNKIGIISEAQGHHPLIELSWGSVSVSWWSHEITGLQEIDFEMAIKTNEIYQKEQD